MLRLIAFGLIAILIAYPSAPRAEAAENQATGRTWNSHPARGEAAQPGQERLTRAAVPTRDLRHSLSEVTTSRASESASVGERMASGEHPHGARAPGTASPHATDPGVPHQAMTRSEQRSTRAPDSPSAQRSQMVQTPRMEIAHDTRTTRASFEDWLFGR